MRREIHVHTGNAGIHCQGGSEPREDLATEPRRMTAEEKDALLKAFHPDYKEEQFTRLQVGPNAQDPVPLELAELLQSRPRVLDEEVNLSRTDLAADVLVIGGGGAGCAAALEAQNTGASVLLVTSSGSATPIP